MKIINVTPGLLPIPPNGWGAVEKIIWETHLCLLEVGHNSKVLYLDDIPKDADVVHIHVANLANEAHHRGIPYYFTMHDHHSYLYGKDSQVYKDNLEAIRNAKRAFVPAKYLVDWFDGIPEYFSHGVNTEYFTNDKTRKVHKLLCVANNGFIHDQSEDRKGFGFAIEAAKRLGLPITIVGPENNKKYFEKFPSEYDKLKIIYNATEDQLREIYREHSVFLHPSVLEAGHPNLTLLEAMASGLPVLATFEDENELDGLVKIERDVDSILAGIAKIFTDYFTYSKLAREQSEKLSWKNRTKELIEKYYKKSLKVMNMPEKNYKGNIKEFKIIDVTSNTWNIPIKTTDEDFWNGIYSDNKYGWWGKESKSGEGSEGNLAYYKTYLINNIIQKYSLKTIIDFGCGDFNWMEKVHGYEMYSGIDIVKNIIESHNSKYSNNKRKFIYGNIANTSFHDDFIIENGKDFDIGILFDILGHQLWDEIQNSLEFIINKLNVQYILVSNSKNCLNPNYWKEKNSRNESIDIEIHPLMIRNGFSIVEEFENGLTLFKLHKKKNMKEQLIHHYNNTKLIPIESKKYRPTITIHNINGPFIEITGEESKKKYRVEFVDNKTGKVEYSNEMGINCWSKCSIKYFVDWNIKTYEDGKLIDVYYTNYKDQTIYIALDSKSLGDTLAWMPYVDEFGKKHRCQLICSTFWNEFFEKKYPHIKFIKPGEVANGIVAMYTIGLFYNSEGKYDIFTHPTNPIQQPLQKIASDILGLKYEEIRPKIVSVRPKIRNGKYVTIGMHSTSQNKYWNNPTGWKEVSDYLKSQNIEPVFISKEGPDYMGNKYPEGVTSIIPNDITEAMELIEGSEFYIGISSGLSWLAWAMGKQVVMISGFTDTYNEFTTNCERIINRSVCNGCWHRHKYDPGDWNFCPDQKGTYRQFECTKLISGKDVIEKLQTII